MKKLYSFVTKGIILIFCVFTQTKNLTGQENPLELVQKMLDAEQQISTLKLTLIMNERIDGDYLKKKADFKINSSPYKIYLKQEYPNKGMEVLYVEDQNNNKAYINPNGFPWVTLHLSPTGKTMREGHHHSIFNSGYNYFMEITKYFLEKHKEDLNKTLTYQGKTTVNGKLCFIIKFVNPDFRYFNYTVQQGETLQSIAKKFHINEYMVIEKNEGKINYDFIKYGAILRLPSSYAKEISISLDANTYLPLNLKAYDDEGLFQEYYYQNVTLNPAFSFKEFDPENDLYNF